MWVKKRKNIIYKLINKGLILYETGYTDNAESYLIKRIDIEPKIMNHNII